MPTTEKRDPSEIFEGKVPLNMLIVDDEDSILRSLHALFHREYNIITALSAEEALSIIEKSGENIHIALVDERMPNMQGHELLNILYEKYEDLRSILITGQSDIEGIKYAVNKGHIYSYFSKPWDAEELRTVVSSATKDCRLRSENQLLSHSLQQMNEALEKQVELRTQELKETNVQLEQEVITRKKAEDELIKLNALLNQANDATFVFDFETRKVIYANDAACLDSGHTLNELYELAVEDISAGENNSFTQLFEKIKSGNKIIMDGVYKKKDGEFFPVEMSGRLVKHEDHYYLVVVSRDISERIELEFQLRHAQKMEALGTLAGGIAHEMNNLLVPILGYSEMLIEFPAEKIKNEEYLKRIYQGTSRAMELVKQILVFGRKTLPAKEPVQLKTVVNDALKFLHRTIPSTIVIERKLDDNLPLAFASPEQIHQVLINLCLNAVQSMPSGGTLKISLNYHEKNECNNFHGKTIEGPILHLQIGDTGEGMTEAVQERIFEPFFTTKEVGVGTGLGLSVVLSIIEEHGGHISVESTLGKGTLFTICLPVSEIKTERRIEQINNTIPRGNHENILLIDDEPIVLELVTEILEGLEYDVTDFRNPQEALEAFKQSPEKFDLIITDLNMPQLKGTELAVEVRKIRSDIPIILSTGHNDFVDSDNCQEWGINELILKPYKVKVFSQLIHKLLCKKRANDS